MNDLGSVKSCDIDAASICKGENPKCYVNLQQLVIDVCAHRIQHDGVLRGGETAVYFFWLPKLPPKFRWNMGTEPMLSWTSGLVVLEASPSNALASTWLTHPCTEGMTLHLNWTQLKCARPHSMPLDPGGGLYPCSSCYVTSWKQWDVKASGWPVPCSSHCKRNWERWWVFCLLTESTEIFAS